MISFIREGFDVVSPLFGERYGGFCGPLATSLELNVQGGRDICMAEGCMDRAPPVPITW